MGTRAFRLRMAVERYALFTEDFSERALRRKYTNDVTRSTSPTPTKVSTRYPVESPPILLISAYNTVASMVASAIQRYFLLFRILP